MQARKAALKILVRCHCRDVAQGQELQRVDSILLPYLPPQKNCL